MRSSPTPRTSRLQGFPALADGAQAARPWYDIAVTYYQPFLHAYDDAPMWKVEPRNLPYRDALKTAHLPGWPGPLSRAQSETIAKFVVIDMFAKACAASRPRK